MQLARGRPPAPRMLAGAGVVAVAAFVALSSGLMRLTTFDTWGAFLLAPVLIVVSLPALSRQAQRESNRIVFLILLAALVAKLAGSILRYYVALDVYGGTADAVVYHNQGVELALRFREGNFSDLGALTGTRFIEVLTGAVYAVLGSSRLAGFMFFSWLGFWGLYFFYRAFVTAVPEGRSRTYARYLFFLPSLLFWPSSIGKESWMVFALGMAALGGAHIVAHRAWRGLAMGALGLWLASLVRPHTAMLLGVSIAVAAVFRPSAASKRAGGLVKVMLLGALFFGASALLSLTDEFLQSSNLDTTPGFGSVLSQVTDRTETGSSRFGPALFDSPTRAPLALVTVLFRPFVFEAHNLQALASGLEGTFLLGMLLLRAPSLVRTLFGSLRRAPYIGAAILYTGLFAIAFSSIANFGILVRQRAQVLPMFLVLLALTPREHQGDDAGGDEDPEASAEESAEARGAEKIRQVIHTGPSEPHGRVGQGFEGGTDPWQSGTIRSDESWA